MKNVLIAWLLLFTIGGTSSALQFDSSVLVTNFFWNSTRNADVPGETFSGQDYFWNWNSSVTAQVSKKVEVKTGILTDPILRHQLYCDFNVQEGDFRLSIGPTVGTFNTPQNWFTTGFRSRFTYSVPGLGFAEAQFFTSFQPLVTNGDTYANRIKGAVGLFLENGIVSFSADDKTFYQKNSTNMAEDNLIRDILSTEVFIKNLPLRLGIDLGYQTLSRNYYSTGISVKTSLNSALIGARLTWDMTPKSTIYLKEENSLFSFGQDQTIYGVPNYGFLFSIETGIRWKD